MPLVESSSQGALQRNIATEISAGKPPAQSAAIGYSVQRASDEYEPSARPVAPASVTLQTLNDNNRKYWEKPNG